MERFKADEFFLLSSQLEERIRAIECQPALHNLLVEKDQIGGFFTSMENYGKGVYLPVSMQFLLQLKARMETTPPVLLSEFCLELHFLQRTIQNELSQHLFLYVPKSEAVCYEQPTKDWEKIIERFKNTVSDIEEASKCFALSRYAAAVFHSLQVIEEGLVELGVYVQVADPKSGWTAVTNALQKMRSKKYEDRTDFERQNSEFLEQVWGTVEALKNAWRNKISHAQGKLILMTRDFSGEIAQEILFATRAFMRRLADGLPVPTAGSK